MKKYKFKTLNFMWNTLVCLLVFTIVMAVTQSQIISLGVAGTVYAAGFIPRTEYVNVLNNELLKTIITSELVRNIYPENTYYQGARVDTDMNGLTISVAQAGSPPKVNKNPEQRPLPMRISKDDVLTYDIDLYETDVDVVTDINQLLTPYDKAGQKLLDHIDALNTRIADEIIIKWYPTAVSTNVIRTTGTGNTGTLVTGMTGTRKEVTEADIDNGRAILDRMGIPDDGRRRMYVYGEQFTREIGTIPAFKDYDKTGIVGLNLQGASGMVKNMKVFKRNVPLLGAAAGNKKVYGAAVAATDCLAIVLYHPDMVRYAKDSTPGVDMDPYTRPGMGGKAFNAHLRGGASPVRKDEKGIVVILQQS